MTNQIKEAALYWAKQGYPVFPCKPENKSPLVRDGFKAATTDPQLIEQWWSQFPNAMIGMPTGAASGITVVDVDVHGEVNGMPWFEEHRADFADAPIVKTPSGGLHIYFIADGTKNSASKIARGVDTRGDGGYVCVPPSTTKDGTYYGWENPLDLFPPRRMPAWVAEKLAAKEPAPAPADNIAAAPDNRTIPADLPIMGNGTGHDRYAQQALENECRQLATCPQGGRNHALNRAAFSLGTLVGAGVLDRDVVIGRLFAAAASCGLVSADGRDSVLATISSGLKGGIAQPRQLDTPTQPITLPQSVPVAAQIAFQEPAGSPQRRIQLPMVGFMDALALKPREWLYGREYIREFISLTVAPGGAGKSALTLAEAVAMASGRKLLNHEPKGQLKVCVINLEDPRDELERRVHAIMVKHNIANSEVADRLSLISGRDMPLTVAETNQDGMPAATVDFEELKSAIKEGGFDVLIVDPFVRSHYVNENANKDVDYVANLFSQLASECRCSVHLVHHTRKASSGETHAAGNADSARGASSLLGAVRAARTVTKMTEDEAESLGMPRDQHGWYIRIDDAKSNLMPPASGTTWFKHESVTIANGESIGALAHWEPPSLFDCMSQPQMDEVLASLRDGPEPGEKYIAKRNSKTSDWAGQIITDITGCTDKQAQAILHQWLKNGLIREASYHSQRAKRDKTGIFA